MSTQNPDDMPTRQEAAQDEADPRPIGRAMSTDQMMRILDQIENSVRGGR